MTLDERLAIHNANIFVREFTYSATHFKGSDGQERELCDGAVWIGDLLILFQNKERDPVAVTGAPEAESQWFNKKVSKLAVDQLFDSVQYLKNERSLPLVNLRGQTLDLTRARESVSLMHLIALYAPSEDLPAAVRMKKGRQSQRVGFVHFVTADDYARVSAVLHTPFEVSDYLGFRREIAINDPNSNAISEKALLGHYLLSQDPVQPVSAGTDEYVDRLVQDAEVFSLAKFLAVYLDRMVGGIDGISYHAVLIELARLRRHTARVFRDRLEWARQACKGTSIPVPARFYVPFLGCSYIFIPLPATRREEWRKDLEALTHLSKHAYRSPKCIGLTVAQDPQDEEYFFINWLYLEFPYEPDDKTDEFIRTAKPFREPIEVMERPYRFQE